MIKLSDIRLVDTNQDDTIQLVKLFNDTKANYPKDQTIDRLFDEQAKRFPDRIALVDNQRSVSYTELYEASGRLASFLQKYGIGDESTVCLLMDNSVDTIIAMLAVLKAGGAYVPIDPAIPYARIKFVLSDCKASFIISQKRFLKTLNRLQWECETLRHYMCMDSDNVNAEPENVNELMQEDLWDYIGENSHDDISGGAWFSSYTGEDLTREDMDEYADNILRKLDQFLSPETRVLEIGCSTGISMFRIAPRVAFYYGTDLSSKILERTAIDVKKRELGNIRLQHLPAHLIDTIDEADFDIIIMNSVVQCFEGHNYFRSVVEKAIAKLKDNGILFLGDIQDQEKKDALIQELIAFREEHPEKAAKTKTDWSNELFLSKEFLNQLQCDIPQIQSVIHSDKVSSQVNELTKFRFDSILFVDKKKVASSESKNKQKQQFGRNDILTCQIETLSTLAKPSSLAYIIYTSGSTGQPKGCLVTHGNVVRLMINDRNPYAFSENDVWIMAHSYNFDFSVWEMYGALLYGGKLIVPLREEVKDIKVLAGLVRQNGVTIFNQTPLAFYYFAEYILTERLPSEPLLPHLRYVIFGGDRLDYGKLQAWTEAFPLDQIRLVNMYGITETTVHVTYYEVKETDITERSTQSIIGKPLPETTVYIFNENKHLAPVGMVGELYVGGTGLCRGYLNRDDLTEERFVESPLKKGERLYKTGDRGRWLPNGDIEFLGRADDQVKIRGFRIEPKEIEARLNKHSGVQEGRVHLLEDSSGEKYLEFAFTLKESTAYPLLRLLNYKINNPELYKQAHHLSNGMVVFHRNKSEVYHAYQEIMSHHTYLKHNISIREGDVIFDVGANIGMFTMYAGLQYAGIRLYAFEPLQPIFEYLEANASLYRLNAFVYNIGFADSDQQVEFTYPNNTMISGRYGCREEERDTVKQFLENKRKQEGEWRSDEDIETILDSSVTSSTYTCQLQRLSNFIRENNIDRIDLLKIDVEKSELDVINGIDAADWEKIRQIVIEVQDVNDRLETITRLLKEKNFILQIDQDDDLKGTNIYNVYGLRSKQQEDTTPVRKGRVMGFNTDTLWVSVEELKKSLQAFALQELPSYMVPSSFKIVEKIPLTANGKLDKKSLLKMKDLAESVDERVFQAPRTETETIISGIWTSILDKEKIGVDENFFEAGGHSLKATRVLSRIQDVFNIKIRLGDFFESPTIEHLASLVVLSAKHKPHRIVTVPQQDHYPVSHAQLRLWILSQFEGSETVYNIPGAFVFEGSLDRQVFQAAIHVLIERHEVFRTSFRTVDGQVRQFICPASTLLSSIEYSDLSQAPDIAQQAAVIAREEAGFCFDLEKGPLFRLRLVRMQEEQHLFLFTVHHIISDAWSLTILIQELSVLYKAFGKGQPNPFSPLTIQYKDYSAWQFQELKADEMAKHKAYWLDLFKQLPPILEFPTDRPRPKMKAFRGNGLLYTINKSVTQQIRSFAQQHNVTDFTFLMAVINVLLHKYTRQNDLVVGTTLAGRDVLDLENQVGFYVNTVPLRTTLNSEETFESLLDRVKGSVLGAFEHQLYPFDQLIDDLSMPRDTSRSPLFDILVEMINVSIASDRPEDWKGINVIPYASDITISKFDLTFRFFDRPEQIDLVLEYNTDLFKDERIEYVWKNFQVILSTVLSNVSKPIHAICLETEGDLTQRLKGTLHHAPYQYSQQTVSDLIGKHTEASPTSIALWFGNATLTYGELSEKSSQLATYLVSNMQICIGDVVGVLCHRSPDAIIGLLAILKAGAAFLPLDPETPVERTHYMLENSGAKAVLLDSSLINHVTGNFGGGLFALDVQLPMIATDKPLDLPVVHAEQLAYVIYTSGSTGRPKGVAIEHGNFFNYVNWANEHYFQNEKGHIFGLFTALTFDLTITSIFCSLTRGDELVIMDTAEIDRTLLSIFGKQSIINTVKLTPAHVSLLEKLNVTDTNVSTVILGGEAVNSSHVRVLHALNPFMKIWNEYGPTETTVGCMIKQLSSQDELITVGRAIANTDVFVLDETLQHQAPFIPGEVCVGGLGVAREYLNNPQATSERFVSNPFSEGRLYKTGDVGYSLPDGELVLLGRMDEQVKIRGYRIEPQEISETLRMHEAVSEAVTLVKETGAEKQLVAFVTLQQQETTEEALRSSIERQLPAYMVPARIYVVESIPLTAHGKIDRRQLLQWIEVNSPLISQATYVAPETNTEKKLAAIWEEVLGHSPIGIHDNFFVQGGHSLKAILVVSRIHEELGIRTDIGSLFSNPTIELLAKQLEQSVTNNSDINSIRPLGQKEYYPLSHAQRRLWVLAQLGDRHAYNIPGVIALEERIDKKAFEGAIEALVDRHEILRTGFVQVNDYPYQKIYDRSELEPFFTFIDLREATDSDHQVKALAESMVVIAFDLTKPPLLKTVLAQLNDDQFVFLFTMHHIISDGWSMQVIVRDVRNYYETLLNTSAALIPAPLSIQYKDYASWQNTLLNSSEISHHKEYWKRQFEDGVPVLNLPTRTSRPPVQTFHGRTISVQLPELLHQKLIRTSNERGTTLFSTLFAAVNALLFRYSGQTSIVLGVPVAGRDMLALEDQIGFYVNLLAVRSTFSPDDTFDSLVEKVKTGVFEALHHQLYPFDKLVDDLGIDRNMSRSPLFDVMVSLQDFSFGKQQAKIERSTIHRQQNFSAANTVSKYDLTFDFTPQEASLLMSIEYNTDLFDHAFIERMAVHFERLAFLLTDSPAIAIKDAPYLLDKELHELTYVNTHRQVNPPNATLTALLDAQVHETPLETAVVFGNEMLNYATLQQHAAHLAAVLMYEYAVTPGDVVAIMLERSIHLPVIMLAILKAGAAYLPLDIAAPDERVKYQLQDASAKLLITQNESSISYGSVAVTTLPLIIGSLKRPLPNVVFPTILENQAAYVIYTSGSTGMPKGIVVLHQNIVSCLLAEKRLYKFSKTLVTCHTTNYSFDVSLLEIFLPLVCGGFVVIPDGDIFSAAYLPALLQRSSVTVLQGTPSFFRGFLELLPQQGQKVLPSLQHLCIGGESLTYDLVERIHQRLPHVQVNNHYGPTEITIDALVNTHISQFDKNILGIPLPNTTVYVLDGTFKPVPKGIVGQICIGGLGVSQGYIHTSISDNFRTDPFASQGLMYCTGDLGRWTEDIKIEFFGRMDDQVKIRGNRVELGEIEACLLKHESVSEAILSVLKDESGQDYLVAYYTGSEGVNDAKLHDFLSQYLPQYMIPAFFIKADKFQYTSSGKIDKKELLPPQRTVSGAAIEYTAPENEVERHLLQVVEAVLAKAPISLKANFFEQGGDSIKAIQVAARLNHLGYTVAIKDIFLYPTFAEIAKAMKRSTHQIDQSAVSGKVPLTPIQQEFFETVRTSPHHYNHAILLRSTDRILIDVVRAVFQELAKHHDTLRTGFKINQDAIVQLVYPVEEFEPTIYEADLREAEDDKGQLEHEVNQLQSSLDFTSGSLWKAGLFHLKEDDRLLIIIHHLLIDGVSWRILLEDLQTLYGQWQRKQPWMLPLKTDSFQHWAKQLQQYATSETLLGEVSYWRGVLSENYQPLPGDEVILDNLKRDEASTSFKLDKAQTKALLTEVNTTYKTEINDILLTALSLSMSETFGMSSIMIALEGHGREELFAATNITRTIGWFTSVYPIIVHIGASKDLAYQIKHTKETLRSIPTKGIGYGVLKYCTPPHLTGDLDFKKKPHLGFNYLGQVDADIENMSLGVAEESSGLTQSLDGERDFALEVQAIVVEGKLQLRIAYNSLQFENKTMDTLANTLQAELVRIIAHCTMQKYKELVTPSDLGFKDISIQQLETFFNS